MHTHRCFSSSPTWRRHTPCTPMRTPSGKWKPTMSQPPRRVLCFLAMPCCAGLGNIVTPCCLCCCRCFLAAAPCSTFLLSLAPNSAESPLLPAAKAKSHNTTTTEVMVGVDFKANRHPPTHRHTHSLSLSLTHTHTHMHPQAPFRRGRGPQQDHHRNYGRRRVHGRQPAPLGQWLHVLQHAGTHAHRGVARAPVLYGPGHAG